MVLEQVLDPRIEHVFIDADVWDSELAQRAREILPASMYSLATESNLPRERGHLTAAAFDRSKRLLHLTAFKGQFFKRCPGARPGLTCCNYFVLNLGLQCNMNCSYCYLQSFINTPVMKVYTNIDAALKELAAFGPSLSQSSVRIGTGEVIDSLSLDPFTLYSRKLIAFFRDYPKWRLEFKTKSACVEQFVDQPHAGNVIVSWSINPQQVIAAEEHGTASLDDRLRAARQVRDRGFLVSFHIDPMIHHPGWEDHYADLVDRIATQFSPDEIPYLSAGALRFQPEQRHMMRERFGMNSLVTRAETFPGPDGKLRYDHALRQQMFRHVATRFKKHDPKWNLFLCMESPETWVASMDGVPKSVGGLDTLFDHRVTRQFRQQAEKNLTEN